MPCLCFVGTLFASLLVMSSMFLNKFNFSWDIGACFEFIMKGFFFSSINLLQSSNFLLSKKIKNKLVSKIFTSSFGYSKKKIMAHKTAIKSKRVWCPAISNKKKSQSRKLQRTKQIIFHITHLFYHTLTELPFPIFPVHRFFFDS